MSGLRLRLSSDVDGGDVVLDETPTSPTDLWRHLVDAGLSTVITRAAADVLADETTETARAVLDDSLGDTDNGQTQAFESAILDLARTADDGARERLVDFVRNLGRTTTVGASSLRDAIEGPVSLVEASRLTPTVVVPITSTWFDATDATQRSRWLSFVVDMAEGVEVVLACSVLTRARLVRQHAGVLPASSVNEVRQHTGASGDRCEPARRAEEAMVSLGPDHPAWRVLALARETSAERVPIARLSRETLTSDVSRTANSKRVTALVDAGVAERVTVDGEQCVALTPAGVEAMEVLDSERGAIAKAESNPNCPASSSCGENLDDVNDPPKSSAGAVYAPSEDGGSPPRPDGEGEEVASSRRTTRPSNDWLPMHHHHGAAAAAPAGTVALEDSTLRPQERAGDRDPRDRGVSISTERREIVVSVEADKTMSLTAARLAAAVLDEKVLHRVLTDDRLGKKLENLADGHLPVLRLARTMGYLPTKDANPQALRDRLGKERCRLLEATKGIRPDDGDFRSEHAAEVMRRSHGLLGTVTQMLDLLDWTLVREVRLPEFSRNFNSERFRYSLAKFMATQTAVSSRYGHYTAYRVLCEGREEKREQMLGKPVVDPDNPRGDVLGSWLLRGDGTSKLRPELQAMGSLVDVVDDDVRNAAGFLVEPEVVDADRREAVVDALDRMADAKRIETTEFATDVLHAVLATPLDAAKAWHRLGAQDASRRREVYPDEVRWMLASLRSDRLFPSLPRSAGAVVSALLEAGELTTSELAERAGVSKQTIRNRRDELAAAGLLQVDEATGHSTTYRLALPTREEREAAFEGDAPMPRYRGGEDVIGGWEIHDVVSEMLSAFGVELALDEWETWMGLVDGTISVEDLVDRWPRLAGWTEVLTRLLGAGRDGRAPPGPQSGRSTIGRRPSPGETHQISLMTASD